MPDPITWQAMQAIASEMAVVRIANGYHTDIGADASLEPTQIESGDAPRVVFGMQRLTVRELATGLRETAFTAIVECQVPGTHTDAQQRAHECIADVLRVFPSSVRDIALVAAPTIAQVASASGDVLPRPEGAASSVAQVRLTVIIREVV